MKLNAPLLVSLLLQLLTPSKREDKTVRPAPCVCINILLKLRSQKCKPCPSSDWTSTQNWSCQQTGNCCIQFWCIQLLFHQSISLHMITRMSSQIAVVLTVLNKAAEGHDEHCCELARYTTAKCNTYTGAIGKCVID